jgi:type II secretory pathway predicted ATPase ExeA
VRKSATTTPQAPPSAPRDGPFPYRDYEAARAALRSAITAGHFFGCVLGASGTGKSTLPRQLAQDLEGARAQIVYVSSASASSFGLVNTLARALRVPPMRSSLETAQLVAGALKGTPMRYVLWIDEGDQVRVEVLREARVVAEADLAVPQILSVVLSGLPELRSLLDAPELFPLKRRITLRCQLAGLGRDELDAFLAHRFGATTPSRFAQGLQDEIFERTEAIPAQVDKVVRFALGRAGTAPVSDAILREAFDACL